MASSSVAGSGARAGRSRADRPQGTRPYSSGDVKHGPVPRFRGLSAQSELYPLQVINSPGGAGFNCAYPGGGRVPRSTPHTR